VTTSAAINLTPGNAYEILMRFAQNLGGHGVTLQWDQGNGTWEDVPASMFTSGSVSPSFPCSLGAVTLMSGTALDLTRTDSSLANLISSYTNSSVLLSDRTMTVGSNNNDETFSGTISGTDNSRVVKTGSGQWTLTGANSYIGGATVNSGTVNINAGGSSFTIGTGPLTVNQNGAIHVSGNTNVIANGDVIVDGGRFQFDPGGSFTWPAGKAMLVENGLFGWPDGGSMGLNGTVYVSAGGRFVAAASTWVGPTGTFNVNAGGRLESHSYLAIEGGTINVTGAGSSLSAQALAVHQGTLSTSDGAAAATTWDIYVGNSGLAGEVGTLNIGGNGDASSVTQHGSGGESLIVGEAANSTGTVNTGTYTFEDPTGTININAAGTLNALHLWLGGTTNVTGADARLNVIGWSHLDSSVNVSSGAQFTSAYTEMLAGSAVNINGGTVTLGNLSRSGGRVNLLRGSLTYDGDLSVDFGGLLGDPDVNLGPLQSVTLTGTTAISQYAALTLSGGTLNTGSLVNNGGLFSFNTGTLGITGGAGLAIGSRGPLGPLVTLRNGQNLNVTNTATVDAGALLEVQSGAGFTAGTLANNGEVVLSGLTATLAGGTVDNAGLIHGQGRITAAVHNNAGGEIRAEAGQRINLRGANGPNLGKINLQGGTAEFTQALTNSPTGLITGRGTLMAGGAGLTNQGNVQFSAALTDVYGPVDNAADAKIITSGGGTTTFYNNVANAGEVRTSQGCTSAFFGDVTLSGSGAFNGTGVVDFEGQHPGSGRALVTVSSGSPSISARVLLGSDATFDTQSGSLEVSGPISGHQRVTKTGPALLVFSGPNSYSEGTLVDGGTLLIATADSLPLGGSVTILPRATLSLAPGLNLGAAGVAAAGPIVAVPEPATLELLAAGVLAGLAAWLQRRARK
jgi:autotransporter-associated beta strand protein